MNKKPVLLRCSIALLVVATFAAAMYPITPRDFYATFEELLSDKDTKVDEVVELARSKQEQDPNLYDSQALLDAADELGVDLSQYVPGRHLTGNGDVVAEVRRRAAGSIRLGLDLNGGVEFLLELVSDEPPAVGEESERRMSETFDSYRDKAIEILRNRLESQNIFEAEISPAGGRFISLRVPVVSQDEKLKLLRLIQMSAKLEFRLVHERSHELVRQFMEDPRGFLPPVGYERMMNIESSPGKPPQKNYYFVRIQPEMDGKNITYAAPSMDSFGQRRIQLRFNREGARQFGEVTERNIERQLAIVLDGKLYSAPVIRTAIRDGSAEISGRFSSEEAESISNALASGSLPVRMEVEAVFDTDPTLGAESVQNGIRAGLIGLALVVVFMAMYYLKAGLVANIALFANMALVLGAMAAFEATLTLPGIAGIILTIGMSVDANVLIFERIREELKSGKSLLNAIDNGYSRAFTTILDANLTTLFTALILMWQGTGAIKGFAITLSIGIVASMFTALFLTRLVFDILARASLLDTLKMCSMFSETKIDFLKMRKAAFAFSGAFVLLTVVAFGVRGIGVLGVDFTGGTQLVLPYQNRPPIADVDQLMTESGYAGATTTYKTSLAAEDNQNLEIVIRDDRLKDGAGAAAESPMLTILGLLQERFPDAGFAPGQETSLGGLVGLEFTKAAIIAIICAVIGIIIYISIRFEFAYAVAAMTAVVHDVVIATGIYIALGRELSLPVVAATLTIIGYSLNDTIVVFDRIREDLALNKDKTYKDIINLSINQTLSRTMLTSLTTLLVLVVLFLAGGVAINNFVLVMLTGVVVGTYSSIFIASPIVAVWHRRIGRHAKNN